MNNIREYLVREAARLTDAAGDRFHSKEQLIAARPRLLAQYLDMMGLPDLPPPAERHPPPVTVTAVTDQPAFVIERLHYESRPGLHVTANLYIPRNLAAPAPAVLYVCGHSPEQKFAASFQSHCRRWAELGFVVLIVDTIQSGEVRGHHHGVYAKGWFHWCSQGYTPAGVELLNGVRGLDLLAARPEVESARLGVTGISGGGGSSWWIAAADERVKAAAPVCGSGTLRSHIAERTLDGHCDCMFFVNYHGWDLADLGALIAPRAFLVGAADRDAIYSIASIRECCRRAARAWRLLDAEDRFRLVEGPGRHSYPPNVTRSVFSWFFRHLRGEERPPETFPDLNTDGVLPPDALRVYIAAPPPVNAAPVIHDSFVPLAAPPAIASPNDLARERRRIVSSLRERSFSRFPDSPPDLDVRVEYEYAVPNARGRRVSFVPEDGWRLAGRVVERDPLPPNAPSPFLVSILEPGKRRQDAEHVRNQLHPSWRRFEFEPRGVGETSWADDLAWHVRRACAVTGRSLASMRVWDTLRAIQAVRALPECDGTVAVSGHGDMGVVALYAALLDGNLSAVVLASPPATHNAPSAPDGAGPAIEIPGVLRFTDLPLTAALLWPAELIFIYDRPAPYNETDRLYARLGSPGRVTHLRDQALADWHPFQRENARVPSE